MILVKLNFHISAYNLGLVFYEMQVQWYEWSRKKVYILHIYLIFY